MSKQSSVSLIVTVRNEADNIRAFLESYLKQTVLAHELIIVDAGSTDRTAEIINSFTAAHPELNTSLFILPGSKRGQARNFASTKAKGELLAMTDAGCLLDCRWLQELLAEQMRSGAVAVGGWFQGLSKSKLQEAIVPYFLQLPRHLTAANFIPTSRSFLIAKKTFIKIGGFKETLELSEDYDLMLRLRRQQISWALAAKALVYWLPPSTLRQFLAKIAAFAISDIEAGIIRPKVLSLYLRYFILFMIWLWNWPLGLVVASTYLLWSIMKNYHNCPNSWYYLPLLQISTDAVVMTASLLALRKFNSKVV